MGYFQVRYDSRVVIYDRRGFIRLATGASSSLPKIRHNNLAVIYGASSYGKKVLDTAR